MISDPSRRREVPPAGADNAKNRDGSPNDAQRQALRDQYCSSSGRDGGSEFASGGGPRACPGSSEQGVRG
jgi:hypothetical protein